MSTLNRLAMLFTIAVVIKSGRIPTARAMTLPQLENRQDLPTVAPPPAVTSVAVAPPSSAAVSSVVVSSVISSAAVISSQVAETVSSITPTTSTVITSTVPATSSTAASTLSPAPLSISATTLAGSMTSSAPSSSSTSSSEGLSSPHPKPNYAPGGMAFILPAFVVIGLIFIIWLIYKTKEYIWKLKEAEELADMQSPDPAKPAPSGKGAKAKDKGNSGGGPGKIGGAWKKKGWKELDSEEDEKWERRERERDRDRDRYSRVGEWQGSRKYRSRDRGEPRRGDPYERSRGGYGGSRESWDDRDRDRRYRGDDRGGYGRVREREEDDDMEVFDMYDRREDIPRRQSRRSNRVDRDPPSSAPPARPAQERPPPQRNPEQGKPQPSPNNPDLGTIPIPQSGVTPAVQAAVQTPATALGQVPHPPSRPSSAPTTLSPPTSGQVVQRGMSRKEKKDRAEEWIKKEKEWNEGRHHAVERREIVRDEHGKDKVPDAYEDEFEERYTNHLSMSAVQEGEKGLDVKIGQAGYTPVNQVKTGSAVIPPNAKPSETVSSPKEQNTATAVIPSQAPRPTNVPPTHPHSPPAYMRARAISPPQILSPPMNPNLFFHVGPSVTELVPLSTYDSATDLDLESTMTPMPASHRDSAGQARREKEHMRMPSIPSTAEKLERSGTAGPGRTVRKVGTPTSSRVIGSGLERTPTRTKSHDTSTPRADIHRTPTRRGTDTMTNRVTPTIRLVDSRGGSLRRNNTIDSTGTPQLNGKRSINEGLTPKRYSKRIHPAAAGTGTPESTRKFRAQRKEQKARGKVDEILRDSWSERAVVSPVGMDVDDDEGEDKGVEASRGGVGQTDVPRSEVELAHARSRATSPTPTPRSPPQPTRPLSPRKAPIQGITSGGESVQDVAMLQGIEQRIALMKELELRARKAAEKQMTS